MHAVIVVRFMYLSQVYANRIVAEKDTAHSTHKVRKRRYGRGPVG